MRTAAARSTHLPIFFSTDCQSSLARRHQGFVYAVGGVQPWIHGVFFYGFYDIRPKKLLFFKDLVPTSAQVSDFPDGRLLFADECIR